MGVNLFLCRISRKMSSQGPAWCPVRCPVRVRSGTSVFAWPTRGVTVQKLTFWANEGLI